MNSFLKITLFSILVFEAVNLQCWKSIPACKLNPPKNILFEDWFINPTERKLSDLISSGFQQDDIGSVLSSLRKNAREGANIDTMTDLTGTRYVLGSWAPRFKTDSLYPLIIYLHGGIGTELNTKGDSAYKMFSFVSDSLPVFLASPSANRYTPWWSPSGLYRILQTLRYMTLAYPIDPHKIFLAGVSDGATGCWAAAGSINSPFAGFVAISGFGGMLPSLGVQLDPNNLMQRPIYNINAGNDRLYPIAQVNQFLDYMEQSGVRLTRKVYPEEQHGFDYRAKELPAILEILRTWSRPDYHGICWTFIPGIPNLTDNIFDFEYNGETTTRINGAFRADTLSIRSAGLSSVAFYSDLPELFVKINNSPIKRFSRAKTNLKLQLLSMQHDCFPTIHSNFFTITLDGK